MTLQLKKSGSYTYLYAIKSFRKEDGRGPRSRRGRDSTDRCVPARSPSAADHERACLLQSQKKSKGPKSPTQRSGALNYPCFYKIKESKTGSYEKKGIFCYLCN